MMYRPIALILVGTAMVLAGGASNSIGGARGRLAQMLPRPTTQPTGQPTNDQTPAEPTAGPEGDQNVQAEYWDLRRLGRGPVGQPDEGGAGEAGNFVPQATFISVFDFCGIGPAMALERYNNIDFQAGEGQRWPKAPFPDYYLARFTSRLWFQDEPGVFVMCLTSDNSSRLFLDNELFILNEYQGDGPQRQCRQFTTTTARSVQELRVEYLQLVGEKTLSLMVYRQRGLAAGGGFEQAQVIPASWYLPPREIGGDCPGSTPLPTPEGGFGPPGAPLADVVKAEIWGFENLQNPPRRINEAEFCDLDEPDQVVYYPDINFVEATAADPWPGVEFPENYLARLTTRIKTRVPGRHIFCLESTSGARFYLNEFLIVRNITPPGVRRVVCQDVNVVEQDQVFNARVESIQASGTRTLSLKWLEPGAEGEGAQFPEAEGQAGEALDAVVPVPQDLYRAPEGDASGCRQ